MKRAWILWPAAFLVLLALAWMGAVVYVQAEARRDVETLLDTARTHAPLYDETKRVAFQGCRALPALVAALDPDADPARLHHISVTIRWLIVSPYELPFAEMPSDVKRTWEIVGPLTIDTRDSPEVRARKIEGLREWWAQEGALYHQPWRFWSKDCRRSTSP